MSFVSYAMNPTPTTVRREIERLLQDVAPVRANGWAPAANGYEDANGFTMEFDVPGFAPADLDVTAQDGAIVVSGKHAERENAEGVRTLFAERPFASFERRVRLPKTADVSNITASYVNGVLTLRVAKLATMAPRKIQISTNEHVNESAQNS